MVGKLISSLGQVLDLEIADMKPSVQGFANLVPWYICREEQAVVTAVVTCSIQSSLL